MTYKEAVAIVEDLRSRFDSPFGASDKATIEKLYIIVVRKQFVPTTCQQCYHDALIEIYLTLKNSKAMPEQCNYVMKAGFIISCPDFYHGKIFTNENLTDKVAHEYLTNYPHMESYFQKIPSDELIENKQPAGSDKKELIENKQPAGSDKKELIDQAEKAGKEE